MGAVHYGMFKLIRKKGLDDQVALPYPYLMQSGHLESLEEAPESHEGLLQRSLCDPGKV